MLSLSGEACLAVIAAVVATREAVASAAATREAVVVPVGPADASTPRCTRGRLEALAASAGRSVEALTEEPWNASTYTVDEARAVDGAWKSFAGRRSGLSKPNFVRWLAASGYEAAWHVEADVFFTGPWAELFDAAPTGDLVAGFTEHARGTDWNNEALKACRISSRPCSTRGALTQTRWPVLRMSRRLAVALAAAFDADVARGYHEALVAPFCRRALPDCLIAPLNAGGGAE